MFWEISSDFARLSLISIDVDSLDKTLEMSIEFGRFLKILIEIDKLLEIYVPYKLMNFWRYL